ncbi:MAG: gp58-like family protein [Bacteroidales bacterium]|nr:gp58-like family protein [Bacteroidales bacterium]
MNGNAEFRKNLSSKDFISGFTAGKGWAIMLKEYLNAAGVKETKSYAEFDNLTIRGTLRVFEFIVSQMLGENDNRTFTAMMEVDHYDPATGKVYLDTQDGKLYNPFRVDDVIVVQQYQPGNTGAEGGNGYVIKSYELVITDVGVGNLSDKEERLDWVTFKNFVTTMEGVYPKDLITQHDTFVRIDNLSDPTRKGIVQMMTVGENTPYMDVIYGAKTDPNNKLKTRVGNMEGIYNHLLGWLHEWGLYAINAYLVGEMKIAHTGMDVSNRIEMTANNFSTNYRALEFNVPEQDNFFSDPSFTDGLWEFGNTDTAMFVTGGGDLLYLNRNIYAKDDSFVGLVEYNGRQMLRICNSYIKLDSNYIREAGMHKRYMNTTELRKKYGRTVEGETEKVYDMEQMAANYLNPKYVEEWDNMYLAMRFICRQSGVVRYGFKSMTPDGYTWYETTHHPTTTGVDTEAREVEFPLISPVYVQTTQDIDFVIEEDSGAWDGVGDFYVYVEGEIYLDFLTLTNQPLDAFKSENSTKIEQDAFHISLMAERTVGNTQNIARLTVRADLIEGFVGEYLDGDLTLATLIQQTADAITLSANNYTDGKFATLSVRADGIEARVANNEGDIAQLELTAQGLAGRITNAEGDINNLKVTARGIEQRVTTAEGNIGTLIADAEQLFNELEDAEGNISTLQQTASSFSVRISDAEDNISAIEQTATSLTTRITNAEGDISTLEQTATSLSSRITSEVNGLQSQITQTADMIDERLGYEDSNGNWVWASSITQEIEDTVDGKVSTITIDADQVNIDGNINLADTMGIENDEVSFYGDIYQGFYADGNHYITVEVSRGHGSDNFYGSPHIELNDYVYTDRWYHTWAYSRLSTTELSFTSVYSGSNDVALGVNGLTIENTSSGASVTIEEDRIIISDGTNTKTITATS